MSANLLASREATPKPMPWIGPPQTCGYGVIWIQLAMEGMACWSTRNSMYQPGGVRLGLVGTVAWRVLLAWEVMVRSTSRWPLSKEWVVTPFLTSDAHRMVPAWGVVMVMVWP